MTNVHASAAIKEAEVSLIVTRANGDVEDLGVVAYYNKSRWARIKRALTHRLYKAN